MKRQAGNDLSDRICFLHFLVWFLFSSSGSRGCLAVYPVQVRFSGESQEILAFYSCVYGSQALEGVDGTSIKIKALMDFQAPLFGSAEYPKCILYIYLRSFLNVMTTSSAHTPLCA